MTDEELDALVERLDNLFATLEEEGYYTKANTADFARKAITTLRTQLAEVQARIAAMESGDWSEVKLVRFENGQMDISAGPIPAIAEYLAQMMQDGEGKYFNYVEMTFDHKTAGPMTLSLQRKNGKTPNQLRKEAEARADRAEQRVATLEAALAAQIEADAGICGKHSYSNNQYVSMRMIDAAREIRAQPHDRTALDRMLAEHEVRLREAREISEAEKIAIRNKALREAADLANTTFSCSGDDAAKIIHFAILALIDSEQQKENMKK